MDNDDIVSRIYSNFRGVDFRGDEINIVRSPDSLNVWKDYKNTESIRTRPGMALLQQFDEPVYGIYFYGDAMIVHSGTALYEVKDGVTKKFGDSNSAQGTGFVFEGAFYFLNSKRPFSISGFSKYDGNDFISMTSNGYVPTTTISRKPSGGGEQHEDANLLSTFRKNSFRGDGESTEYYLDVPKVTGSLADVTFELIGNSDDELRIYSYELNKGKVTFNKPPPKPLTDGQDNVIIRFNMAGEGESRLITDCTMIQMFDNRVFFSGNPNHPNKIWHCALHDPSYCSDTDEYTMGVSSDKITGLVAGNNVLWVFLEPSAGNTSIFYLTPTVDEKYGKIYPDAHSNIATGCVGKAINFNDDIVFFSERGMEGIHSDITTEQAIAHRSSLVDRKLTAENEYRNMLLAEWEGYLLVFLGKKVYLADSRAVFTNENHYEYEWFYWEMEKEILCTQVKDGVLYLGASDGVYTLTDMTANIPCYWVTAKDKFKHPHRLKTTNKRGCVAEATGDISVYAKTEDTDFELIGEYKNVTDYFVSRIKRKKFKDIQLKFQSNTRFSLETVTLEAFIGGYIKR